MNRTPPALMILIHQVVVNLKKEVQMLSASLRKKIMKRKIRSAKDVSLPRGNL
jgi:hypothetical protein